MSHHCMNIAWPHSLTSSWAHRTGGPYSGAALNPARVLGPSMVFHCYWDTVPVYICAQLLGATIAACLTMPLYGFGPWVVLGRMHQDLEVHCVYVPHSRP